MKDDYFIFAGELSGDLHGSRLIQALHTHLPTLQIHGVGGPAMRTLPFHCVMPMEAFQVMGFSDVFRSLPKLIHQFYTIRKTILDLQPKCVILIDYPGFNLRLARSLRQKGFRGKIIQYICPTVWAHGKSRIDLMAAHLDLLLTIFPFEADYFKHTPLPVKYIGNPLAEMIQKYTYDLTWFEKVKLCPESPIAAIFPGSRLDEIKRHLPLQLEALHAFQQKHSSIQCAISYSQDQFLPLIRSIVENSAWKSSPLCLVPPNFRYELMKSSRMAVAKSGTITLELALHGCPTAVIYQLSQLNYYIAKYILRLNLPYYSLPNLLAKREIFPELIGTNISLQSLLHCLEQIYSVEYGTSLKQNCRQIQQDLGGMAPSKTAVEMIQDLLC